MVDKKHLSKVVLLGDLGVGKTTLIQKFVDPEGTQSTAATVGGDMKKKEVKVGGT